MIKFKLLTKNEKSNWQIIRSKYKLIWLKYKTMRNTYKIIKPNYAHNTSWLTPLSFMYRFDIVMGYLNIIINK